MTEQKFHCQKSMEQGIRLIDAGQEGHDCGGAGFFLVSDDCK
jgi:hypothetical protein